MSNLKIALFTAAALGTGVSVAHAADMSRIMSPAVSAANQDYGMLSKQGAMAFQDIRLARLAIFDGQPGKAKQALGSAGTALKAASSDAAAYTKAESDLTPPPGMAQQKSADDDLSGPVKWLPVDGAMSVDEDYAATPAKKAGVAKADQQLKTGDRKGAMDTLKLADVDVLFDMEVIPLDRSVSKVENAQSLLNQGHYYEANQVLKSLEDGARFDVASVDATPKPGAAGTPANAMAPSPAKKAG